MERRNPDYNERMGKRPSGAPLLAGLMIGGLVGAGAMLLLAPQSGRETREEITEGASEFKDRTTENVRGAVDQARSRAQQMASNVREKASSLQDQGREIAIDQLDKVSSVAQKGKKNLQSSRGQTGTEASYNDTSYNNNKY